MVQETLDLGVELVRGPLEVAASSGCVAALPKGAPSSRARLEPVEHVAQGAEVLEPLYRLVAALPADPVAHPIRSLESLDDPAGSTPSAPRDHLDQDLPTQRDVASRDLLHNAYDLRGTSAAPHRRKHADSLRESTYGFALGVAAVRLVIGDAPGR